MRKKIPKKNSKFFSNFVNFFAIRVIFHLFLIKISSDIKMGQYFFEKNCHRISEIYFLPSLRAKLLITVWDETPCSNSDITSNHLPLVLFVNVVCEWPFKDVMMAKHGESILLPIYNLVGKEETRKYMQIL